MHRQIPLRFNDRSYYGSIDPEHLCLSYTVRPCGLSQRRFKNMLLAEPSIDLLNYEFKTVFDWIDISVTTLASHIKVNLHRQLNKLNETHHAFRSCFVSTPTRERWVSGREFIIRMQDPQPKGLRSLLRALLISHCSRGTELNEIPVTGLELSLDVYPARNKGFGPEEHGLQRMLMTELLRKHISVSDAFRGGRRRPRFTFLHGSTAKTDLTLEVPSTMKSWIRKEKRSTGIGAQDLAARLPEAHRQPFIDATFYFGQKDERLHYRCMDKLTDNRTERDADLLPSVQTRSRIELTYIDEKPGDRLGPASSDIESIDEIASRGLKRFNTLLLFELPVFNPDRSNPLKPDDDEWEVFSRTGVAGLAHKSDVDAYCTKDRAALRAFNRREVTSSGKFVRYKEFNRRLSRALKRLQDRWEEDWGLSM